MSQAWGVGDTFAVCTAVATTLWGVVQPKPRTYERLAKLAINGVAFGPLLLIILSPLDSLIQWAGWNIDLLDIAINEARVAIWVTAVISLYQLAEEIL